MKDVPSNHGPDIYPGSRIAVEVGGVLYTDTVSSVATTQGQPAIWPELTRWQRAVHRLTLR